MANLIFSMSLCNFSFTFKKKIVDDSSNQVSLYRYWRITCTSPRFRIKNCHLTLLQGLLHVPSWSSGVTFMTEGSYEQQLAAAFAATHLESVCELDIDSIPHVHRMSGLICTIGE
jgi:hypothetical protein